MINLKSKLKNNGNGSPPPSSSPVSCSPHRVSIRDRLLAFEVTELHDNMPNTCQVDFPCSSSMHRFNLTIRPDSGYWRDGAFMFVIDVPPEYNNVPPSVRCLTPIYHPNITEDGRVCLSILRSTSLDGNGWTPIRHLKDVVWGLSSLFSDLVDFDDALNVDAAELYRRDSVAFASKVGAYIKRHCDRNDNTTAQQQVKKKTPRIVDGKSK